LVNDGGKSKDVMANIDFVYSSVSGKNLDGPTSVGAINALEKAEQKGVLDRMHEKGLITPERHKFLSDRLGSYLWNDPIRDQYLLNLQEEKELIEKLVTGKIIDQETQAYFNSEEWFKQFEWFYLENMFKVLTYGVENEKLDTELVRMLVKSKNYQLASRIAQLHISGELSREETTGLIEKLNTKFANAVLDYPFMSMSFAEYGFEAREVLPLLFVRHAASLKTSPDKLLAARSRNDELLTGRHILGGWMDGIRDSFSDLGIDYYDVLGLNEKDSSTSPPVP
jgi:hypothetical protein